MDEVHRTDDGEAIGLIELGLEMYRRVGTKEPATLREAVASGNTEAVAFSEWMVWMGMRWLTHKDLLIGVAWGFLEVHEMLAEADVALLSEQGRRILKHIAVRERKGLEVCRAEMERDHGRRMDFQRGVAIARNAVAECFSG
jgi:hypothetical protein